MGPDFLRYVRNHGSVQGWLSDETLALTAVLAREQARMEVRGSVAEIGVHHGKYFVALCLLRAEGERALALDVFEDQQANVDGSGKGDREVFVANLRHHVGSLEGIEVVQGDSLEARAEDLLATLGAPTRLFSVDGGHTAKHAKSDLYLAERVNGPSGVVVLDDFFHYYWPGVTEGALDYLRERKGDGLVPFALASNKLYLARPDVAGHFLALFRAQPGTLAGEEVELCGHGLLTLAAAPLAAALGRSIDEVLELAEEARGRGDLPFALGIVEAALELAKGADEASLERLARVFQDHALEGGNLARVDEMIRRFVAQHGESPVFARLREELDRYR